ncbi:DNA gyrase subunit A [Symmachiella dynata]|uniref:DNA topoisomerase (ATP-hydrolyzing) n=2 Tax=Symmachiella dynata TaxID=2527995 RepID=A0A517ZL37_9PLAN|nr:DNA topoisomerase IV subunit A [Symmachiella dynata]QDU43176.1 DNA gyrase subunit A [Symmachiella dynata]
MAPKRTPKRKQSKKAVAAKSKGSNSNGSNGSNGADRIEYVSISQETRRRYLNYAMSVITARALPDIRDGLKPVQRRILYVMFNGLRLTFDAKHRKCSKICGDTTGNFHPHGDVAVYEALCRMAQDFSLRKPLIDGQGNFGSMMGLPAAASRYTEARLTTIAAELMSELRYQTVDMRPTYDAVTEEPVVLPARYPNLLVNGAHGIAVGMMTNIPPHNLGEVVSACIHMIDHSNVTVAQLLRYIKGPDFPLGGRLITDRRSMRKVYEEGRGSLKVRGEWKQDRQGRKTLANQLVIYSMPYSVESGNLVNEIGSVVQNRKLPQLLDVVDETSDDNGLRIVLEIKPGADPEAVMAYLYKHTSLEQNFNFNSTSLIPDGHGLTVPARLNLVEMLQHFLDFRFITVRRRFEYLLEQLRKRIHILEGFEIVFNGLDKALKIIRNSQGKQDAAQKLMRAFPLDEIQTDAILVMQLYKISTLEIDNILEELAEKRAEAKRIERILKSDKRLWGVVKNELKELADEYADKRRTSIGSTDEIAEFDPEAYIVRENANVVVTQDGWIKRVGRMAKVESTRVREGDAVLNVVPGSTLDQMIFFSSEGVAYTMRIDGIPASAGYGDPLGKHFRLGDGAKIVAALSTDVRFVPQDKKKRGQATPAPYLLVATAKGQVLRISLSTFRAISTKAGRKFCRLSKGDRVVFVELATEAETMFLATKSARILHFPIEEVPILGGPGKGVRGIKLQDDDEVLGGVQLIAARDCLRVKNEHDKLLTFGQMKYNVTSRGGKGVKTSHRTDFVEIVRPHIELVDWTAMEESE